MVYSKMLVLVTILLAIGATIAIPPVNCTCYGPTINTTNNSFTPFNDAGCAIGNDNK